ncbi:MAG: chain-length determining protein [Bacteroidaceae bacterium]|nr:chain-length determining protein [Bacteroidaceae bacterium]MBQ3993166.1 chain-length determining protein [Bacteroidaceae bacterium]
MSNNNKSDFAVLTEVAQILSQKKKAYVKILATTFVLSCVIILSQPRYYTCEVKLAPEWGTDVPAGGIGSIAASFGFDLSSMQSSDAIYPMLYPELFESPEFLVPLFDVEVARIDGSLRTTYHDYLKLHQKRNPLTYPIRKTIALVKKAFEEKNVRNAADTEKVNPFYLSKKDYGVMKLITDKVRCIVDKKNNVVSITVKDQDALICATMADSIREHLQNFIIEYRTRKARQDVAHYQVLRDSALMEYREATNAYSAYCDRHQNATLQAAISKRDQLENDMGMMLTKYQTMSGQLENAKAKVQEQTPAFTVIKSPTVPIRPAGPKRMIFVAAMLIIAALGTTMWYLRRLIISELI